MRTIPCVLFILALAVSLATTSSVASTSHVYQFMSSHILYGPKVQKKRKASSSVATGAAGAAGKKTNRLPASVEGEPTAEEIEKHIHAMTLQQKVGQLLLVGFMGTEGGHSLDRVIETIHPGGIVVFSRNIKTARQISALTVNAQKRSIKASTLPLFIAVDQEGGDVLRIRTAMPLPSALSLGDTNNPQLLDEAGHETGVLLKTLGFNMNLAPVLDISDPAEKTFIGTRTYGSEPARVSEMGTHFASGLEGAGVLSTAKHFPGHGGIRGDSHKETPEVDATMKEMVKNDLSPFAAMEEKMGDHWAVMLAHVSYPKLDASGTPATFSKPIVTGILRKQMGFNGLVITDDIEMAGAETIKDTHLRALKAIEAGADMIMVAWNKRLQAEIAVSLMKAVKSGVLPEARVDESLRRIIAFKARYSTMDPHTPTDDELRFALQNPKLEEIGQEVVRSKFARIDPSLTPAFDRAADGKTVYVFTASEKFYQTFRAALSDRKSRHYHLGENQTVDIDRVMRVNPDALGLLYVSGPRIAKLAGAISADIAKRVIVVNVETEGAIKNAADFKLIVDIYYRHPNLGSLTAKHLFNVNQVRLNQVRADQASTFAAPVSRAVITRSVSSAAGSTAGSTAESDAASKEGSTAYSGAHSTVHSPAHLAASETTHAAARARKVSPKSLSSAAPMRRKSELPAQKD